MTNHLESPVERILQEQLVDPGHQRQRLLVLPPSARSRATSARLAATGIAGSGSAPDGRAPLRPAHRTDPRNKKSRSTSRSSNLRVKLPHLALVIPAMALRAVCEYLAKALDRLALPRPYLVRMNLMLRGSLLQGPLAAKRLKRDLRILLS